MSSNLTEVFIGWHSDLYVMMDGAQIAEYRDRGDLNPEEFSIGLDTGFSNVEGQDIGQFPGPSCAQASSKPELVASAH
jgi:hypothetical protein